MYVVGTAGHVDHGKSTLVKALTGIDPDRLKEEKEREMTIDLGFAWIRIDGQEEIGIVDVPGHRDFIENMLAGVGGIDLAILVIAADEGIMPQTVEHLAILDLLKVRGGIVVLTKIDLIDDPDWLELVELDVFDALQGTVFEQAPFVMTSATTGKGIDELRTLIYEQLSDIEEQTDIGQARLPIDRVFSLAGFGTVVTGTLGGGFLHVGDPVELQPANLLGRIRGLQTHQVKRTDTGPGSRVAVNLTGIAKDKIKRGQVLASPGVLSGTILCDVEYEHLPDSEIPLKHNEDVKFFTGAAEVMARVRLIGDRQISPGKSGWLQLALYESVAMVRGDRFILRRPSPAATIGGGRILDPHPGKRHKRFRPDVIQRFERIVGGLPDELLEDELIRREPVRIDSLIAESTLEPQVAREMFMQLLKDKRAVTANEYALSSHGWQRVNKSLLRSLAQYHQAYPLRQGMPREELRSRLKVPSGVYSHILRQASADSSFVDEGHTIRLTDHSISFSVQQQESIDRLMVRFRELGVNAPSVKEAQEQVGVDVYYALIDMAAIIQINNDVVYSDGVYKKILKQIVSYLQANGRIDAAKLRDLLNTSRKYSIAILEHLDEIKVTKRVDDYRVLVP